MFETSRPLFGIAVTLLLSMLYALALDDGLNIPTLMPSTIHVYEFRPRKGKRGVDLIP
jgi:hypothetical protein